MNKKGFVVSTILYPVVLVSLSLTVGMLSMNSTRKNILNNMKLEISDSLFNDSECSCETILNKLNYIINNGIGADISVNIMNYETRASFPKKGNNMNDIAIVSTMDINGYYIQATTPTNPSAGSVWVKIKQASPNSIRTSEIDIPIAYVQQYQNGSWVDVTAAIYNGKDWITLNYKQTETAEAKDIVNGKTAIVNGQKVTGTYVPTYLNSTEKFASAYYDDFRASRVTYNYATDTSDSATNWDSGDTWVNLAGTSGTFNCPENSYDCKATDYDDITSWYCLGNGECKDERKKTNAVWSLKLSDADRESLYTSGKITVLLFNHDGTGETSEKSGVDAFYTGVSGLYQKNSTSASRMGLVPKITIYKDTNSWNIKEVVSNVDFNSKQTKFSTSATDTNEDKDIIEYTSLSDLSIIYDNGFTAWIDSAHQNLVIEYHNINATLSDLYKTVIGFRQNDRGVDLEFDWNLNDYDYTMGGNAAGTWYWYAKQVGRKKITYGTERYRLQARYNYWDIYVDFYKP